MRPKSYGQRPKRRSNPAQILPRAEASERFFTAQTLAPTRPTLPRGSSEQFLMQCGARAAEDSPFDSDCRVERGVAGKATVQRVLESLKQADMKKNHLATALLLASLAAPNCLALS